MATIGDVPTRVSRAGMDFNFNVWTADTTLTLARVPWDFTYFNVVAFDNATARDNYITSRSSSASRITSASYARVNAPVRIAMSFNEAMKYNYIRAYNPGSGARPYYYFIRDVRHIAPGTTEIVVHLDVWNSFPDFELGTAWVERSHLGLAMSGDEHLTTPEGLDLGDEYTLMHRAYDTIGQAAGTVDDPSNGVIFFSTIQIEESEGNVTNPTITSAKGSTVNGIGVGASVYYAENSARFTQFLTSQSSIPWSVQGVIAAYSVPPLSRYAGTDPEDGESVGTGVWYMPSVFATTRQHKLIPDWRNAVDFESYIGSRYSHLRKFLTSPYLIMEMTTWTGTPITLKPEKWMSDDCDIVEQISMYPSSPKIVIYPNGYNATEAPEEVFEGVLDITGDVLDRVTQIGNLPQLMTLNDNAALSLANRANSLTHARESAASARGISTLGAQTAAANSIVGDELAYSQMNIGNALNSGLTHNAAEQARQNAAIQAATGTVTGAAQGGMSGAAAGPAGAAAGAVGGAVGGLVTGGVNIAVTELNNGYAIEAANMQNSSSRAGNAAQATASGAVRDNNLGLAALATESNYETAISGIMAQVNDTKMIPPTTGTQAGGEVFNLAIGRLEVALNFRMPPKRIIREIGEYWLRYGYALNHWVVMENMQRLKVMSKFSYWKLKEVNLFVDDAPETYRQTLRGILERGVTVWSNPDDIGRVDLADNEPRTGVIA